MAKPSPLQSALNPKPAAVQVVAPTREKVEAAPPPARARSRSGRVLVGGHFAPEVATALKVIAAEERTTLQELMTEAIDTVLAKRGRPQIASLTPSQD